MVCPNSSFQDVKSFLVTDLVDDIGQTITNNLSENFFVIFYTPNNVMHRSISAVKYGDI